MRHIIVSILGLSAAACNPGHAPNAPSNPAVPAASAQVRHAGTSTPSPLSLSPLYASMFERGHTWHGVALRVHSDYESKPTREQLAVTCEVIEVTPEPGYVSSTITCSSPTGNVVVWPAGEWVATASGLWSASELVVQAAGDGKLGEYAPLLASAAAAGCADLDDASESSGPSCVEPAPRSGWCARVTNEGYSEICARPGEGVYAASYLEADEGAALEVWLTLGTLDDSQLPRPRSADVIPHGPGVDALLDAASQEQTIATAQDGSALIVNETFRIDRAAGTRWRRRVTELVMKGGKLVKGKQWTCDEGVARCVAPPWAATLGDEFDRDAG